MLHSLTLNWSTGSLFEVQSGLSRKPSSEVNGAETRDSHRVSSFTRRLFQRKETREIQNVHNASRKDQNLNLTGPHYGQIFRYFMIHSRKKIKNNI